MIVAMKGYFEALRQRLPVMMQTEATECGLACMAMVTGYYGLNMDLQALRKHYQVSLKGMSLRDLIVLADRLSLGSRPVRADLGSVRQLKTPCILHWSFNHFVVLKKFSRHGATIIDPAKGERKISLTELSQHFTGIALEIWPNQHFQRRTERETIRLLDMFKNVSGLPRALAHILALSLCIELLAMAVPLAAQFTLDMALRSGDIHLVSLIAWGVIVLLIFRALLSLVRAWMVMSIKYTLGIQWNSGLFSHLIRLPVSYFEKRHIGDVRSRFNSLSVVQDAFTAEMVASLLDIVVVIGLLFLMWAYDGYLAAIAVLISIIYAAIKFFLFGAYRSANLEAIAHEAKQQSHFLETVRGIACVKIFNLAERRRSDWINLVINEANAKIYLFKIDLATQTVGLLLIGLSSAIILWLGAKLIDGGTLTTGMLFAFLIYSDMYVTRAIRVVDSIIRLRLIDMHSERLSEVALATPEQDTGEADLTPANSLAASIEVKDLSYRYGDGEPAVFEHVSLSIKAGESIAIIGPSGCGKSTLLKALGGLAPQKSGFILLDGVDVRQLGLTAYRKHIAYVLQEDKLFAGSLLDNISSFDIHPDNEWACECARLASIHTEIDAMPMKYETMVGDMGSALSGGQCQRISLARALYKRPRILFLDEATSDLDIDNEARINDSLRALKITRIFVAHRPTMIAMADRVFDLSKNAEMEKEKESPYALFTQ
ncbi:ABC transporter family protein [Yersinia rochesterensis]|uniref:ABC transporter family protein n=1 Tax=Yersinia rochesterensis TaxID=1604335 RepID=A0ABN4FJX7_9GAMM|nr:peptidase domain-containing ABC transporter [Yersinia rochesterensis]AIN19839.1 ABC transporter family protein [Yersinia rochesterensis]AJI86665.1 ABC transporter family protein [Yersinia frederiksenii Y225]AJJ37689.1 ABC transporter family protein [Yersinia rochesterensis]CRY60682.1 putative ABC transporter ATP-binding protein [Yersinia kristensenii]